MPNRAERRAQAKAGRRGVPSQYDQTQGRGRSGMIDEYQLQQKSQRLQDGTDGTEWTLIAIAIIAFFVVMWLPSHPMWLIITVSAVFIVGVLSLFFTAGDSKHNPNLDQNGTAV